MRQRERRERHGRRGRRGRRGGDRADRADHGRGESDEPRRADARAGRRVPPTSSSPTPSRRPSRWSPPHRPGRRDSGGSRTEADRVAAELVRDKKEQAAELDRERATALAGLADEKAALEASIARLRQVQSDHRSRCGSTSPSSSPCSTRLCPSRRLPSPADPNPPVTRRADPSARRLGSRAWRPAPPSVSRPRWAASRGHRSPRTADARSAAAAALVGAVGLGTSEAVARARQKEGEIPALWQRIAVSTALAAPLGWVAQKVTKAGPRTVGTSTGVVVGAMGVAATEGGDGPGRG